jgi:hypothetical protein
MPTAMQDQVNDGSTGFDTINIAPANTVSQVIVPTLPPAVWRSRTHDPQPRSW